MSETFSATDKTCSNCGGLVASDSRFCKHCAFDFAVAQQPLPQTESEGTSKKNRYILPLASLAVVLALAAVWIYRSRHAAAPIAAAPSQTMTEKAKQVEARILRSATVTNAKLTGLSSYELRVLRNVHFARYGRVYDRPGLGDYFYTQPWYKPNNDYNDKLLTATDKANVSLILAEENNAKAAEAAQVTSVAVAATPAPSSSTGSSNFQPAIGGGSSSNGPSSATVNAAISASVKGMLNRARITDTWKTIEVKSAAVQIIRQGDYNQEQKYLPVQVTVTGSSRKQPEYWAGNDRPSSNCQFSFSAEYKIQRDDYGDWIAVPHPFWMGPVQTQCDK